MPFVPAPNVAMVEMRYTYQGQQCENTLYFQHSGPMEYEDMSGLAGALVENWLVEVQPSSPDSLTLREVYVTDLTTATSPTYTYTINLPATGEAIVPAAPNNVTLCVSFRTAGRGRSSRGRNYLLGVHEGEVDNNIVSNAFSNRWALWLNTVLQFNVIESAFRWVVLSRYSGGLPRETALAQQIITYTFVDKTVDSMRKRLPGRGR